jgi:hypothetical protein
VKTQKKTHRHTLGCLKIAKGHLWCAVTGDDCGCTQTGNKTAVVKPVAPVAPASWKRSLGQKCPHGLHLVAVDGTYVRNRWDSDYVQGGNGFRYRFVPKGELWIDWATPKSEWEFVFFHECYETERMRAGLSYERAHMGAKRLENKARRRVSK